MLARRWQARLSVGGVALLALLTVAACVTSLVYLRNSAQADALANAERAAVAAAGQVRRKLERAIVIAQSTASAIGELADQGVRDREVHTALLRQTLADNPELLGAWAVFLPNAFDGRDAEFINHDEGHDETGAFLPNWARTDQGLLLEPLVIDYNTVAPDGGAWFYEGIIRDALTADDPAPYPIAGLGVPITSFYLSVYIDGQNAGMAGTDLGIADLQAALGQIRPMGSGALTLLTQSGVIAAAPDPRALGLTTSETTALNALGVPADFSTVTIIEASEGFDGRPVLRVVVPFDIPGGFVRWAIVSDIPKSTVFASVRTATWSTLLIAVLIASVTVAVIVLFRSQLKAQGQLIAARDAAKRANRLKTEFLANMSHEIRTPLNGVMGMTQLLHVDGLTGRQKSQADTIMTSARAVLALLEDVLDISKIEAGVIRHQPEPASAMALLEETRSALSAAAEEKGIRLTLGVAPDAQAPFAGDARRIRQVLLNLAANAVKFTPAGAVRLSALRRNDRIRFEVADTGPGVAPALREVIFDRFRQTGSGVARNQDGAGLSLAMSRDLVQLAGGAIGVEDNPGGGALFWFDLPYTPAGGTG